MAGNVALESLIGAIPVLGDLFDFVFKANARNMRLLERHALEPERIERHSRGWLIGIAVAAVALVLLVGWLVVAIIAGTVRVDLLRLDERVGRGTSGRAPRRSRPSTELEPVSKSSWRLANLSENHARFEWRTCKREAGCPTGRVEACGLVSVASSGELAVDERALRPVSDSAGDLPEPASARRPIHTTQSEQHE